jgi:hypothetical protein
MSGVCFFRCSVLQVFVFMALSTSRAGAQGGLVNFRNQPLWQPPERRVFFPDGVTPISGTNYMAQLLYSSDFGVAFTAHPQTARFYPSTSVSLRGYWSGGNRTLTGVGGPGAPVYLQVRVWNAGFDATPLTFEQAQAVGSYWVRSPVFPYIEEFDGGADDKWMKNFIGGSWLITPIPLQFGPISQTGNELRFYVRGYYDRVVIEAKTSLISSTSWLPVYTNLPPFWFTNSTTGGGHRFFRGAGYYN